MADSANTTPKIDVAEFAEKAEKAIAANVRSFSGCKDHQFSKDAMRDGVDIVRCGACTTAFIKSATQGPASWIEHLKRMKVILLDGEANQVPVLSTSRQMDLTVPFEIKQKGGNHRSLLIGINYVGSSNELIGCQADALKMKDYIVTQGFTDTASTMRVLLDDDSGEHLPPTKATITNSFKWLVDGAQAGDSLFLHYSGHGSWVPDENGDEEDGRDETICPADFRQNGMIVDDDIFDMIIAPLPAGVEFTIVMDSCHSGTVIDLPYVLTCGDKLVAAIESGEAVDIQTEPNPAYGGWDLALETVAMGGALLKYGYKKAMKRLANRLSKAPLS